MKEETNEDARTKQDLLYECNSLESRLSNEIVKNEHLEQQCEKQKEVIDKIYELIKQHMRKDEFLELNEWQTRDLLKLLKEVE